MKKLLFTITACASLLLLNIDVNAQSNFNTTPLLGQNIEATEGKYSPGRVGVLFNIFNEQERNDLTYSGRVEAVDNNGKWVRLSTNESMDDTHFYVFSETAIFEANMLGKWIGAKGNLALVELSNADLNQRNNNSESHNTNPHQIGTPTYELNATDVLLSETPF